MAPASPPSSHAPARSDANVAHLRARAANVAHLRARTDALQQALIVRDAFAHTTAHDLRTPLNTLSGLLHLMQIKFGSELPAKALEYIEYMSYAVTQMDDLSTDFLDHARSVSGPLQFQDIDVRATIDAVIEELRSDVAAAGAQVHVTGSNGRMMADPELLRLMLINLVRNALKHRHPDRALAMSLELHCAQGSPSKLSLRDNGSGFPPHKKNEVFLPVHKEGDAAQSSMELATCHAICKRHAWTISARSDGTEGATFSILFPRPHDDT